jgi:hypothetical protein
MVIGLEAVRSTAEISRQYAQANHKKECSSVSLKEKEVENEHSEKTFPGLYGRRHAGWHDQRDPRRCC